MSNDFGEGVLLTLGLENAVNHEDFKPPSERHLGEEPEIEFEPFRFRIGDRPIARDIRRLYELADRKVPEDLEVFHGNDIWAITYAVSVLGGANFKSVRELGFRMRYPEKPRVTVLEVMPQTKFVKKLGGSFTSEADLDIWGQASVPSELTQLLEVFEHLGFGGKLKLSTKVNVVGRLSFSVVTPVIVATGVGDSGSEWAFQRDEIPLVGDHIMVQIIHTPRFQEKLKFKAQVYTTVVTSYFFPARLQSEWVELTCPLR